MKKSEFVAKTNFLSRATQNTSANHIQFEADYDISIEAMGEDYQMLKNRKEDGPPLRGYYPNILHQGLQKSMKGLKVQTKKFKGGPVSLVGELLS